MERIFWSKELRFLIAASSLSRGHRCQEQGLARFGAQHWPRLACRGTIPKVGALALRLRSSDIPPTHTITRSPMERTHGNDKMKHRSDSYSPNTHSGREGKHHTVLQLLCADSISSVNTGLLYPLEKQMGSFYNKVRENHGFRPLFCLHPRTDSRVRVYTELSSYHCIKSTEAFFCQFSP